MLAAKQQDPSLPIDSSGKWTGPDQLLMVASNADPGKKTGEVAQAQFEKLGFKIKFRTVPQDTLYTKFCNVPAEKIAICPNVGFFKDFNDPQALLDPVFNGNNILPGNNSNWSQLDVPAINDAMDEGGGAARRARAHKAWGDHRQDGHRAGAGDPLPVGQDPHGRVRRRARRHQPVLDELGPQLHLAEVAHLPAVAPLPRSVCTG